MLVLLQLFFEFFKTGLFSVGGGLATIPFLYEMSDKYGWVTYEQLANIIAVAEATPGPIGVNAATYTGYMAGGVLGGIVATIALITPSIIIVSLVAKYLMRYRESKLVNSAFEGVRPASAALVSAAALTVLASAVHGSVSFAPFKFELDLPRLGIFALLLLSTQVKYTKSLHPLVTMGVGAVLGLLLKL